MISLSNGSLGISSIGKAENYGQIDITNMFVRGLIIDDAFHNYPGAKVSITNVTHLLFEGILKGPNGILQNEGQINVSDISGVGIIAI